MGASPLAGGACDPVDEVLGVVAGIRYERRFDPNGPDFDAFELVTPGSERILGLAPCDLSRSRLNEMIQEVIIVYPRSPRDPAEVGRAFRLGEINHYHAHLRLNTPDGRVVWLSDCAVARLDPTTGLPIGAVGVLLDITDRIVAERSLARDERVLDQIADAVIATDMDGTIQRWNAGAERVFGHSASEVLGQSLALIFSPEDWAETWRYALGALASRGFHRFESRNRRRDGLIIWTQTSLALVREPDGTPSGVVAYSMDVTEQRRNQNLAALGLIASELAHSIKNIQTHLVGALRMIDVGLRDGDLNKVQRMWPLMRSSTLRISRVVSDMLGLARRSRAEGDAFLFPALMDGVVDSVANFAQTRGVEIRLEVDPALQIIRQDDGRLYDCLLNLILNAVEAHPEESGGDKTVTVRAQVHGESGQLHLTVEDDGPGIPPELHARVFDPFFTTKGHRGTGLGLAVVRKQVEEMGGEITLDSTLGCGARFRLCLPVG